MNLPTRIGAPDWSLANFLQHRTKQVQRVVRTWQLAAAAFALLSLAACGGRDVRTVPLASAASADAMAAADANSAQLLYGRVTMYDGRSYEGTLRFGGDEEALWVNYFNGRKDTNPWAGSVPRGELPTMRESVRFFRLSLISYNRKAPLDRPFMARMGDIARIEADRRDLWVTLRSGTRFHLDRYSADDLADGLRVWDVGGVVDIHESGIKSIEFFANPRAAAVPSEALAIHGTVRTRDGEFTGFIQWNRKQALLSDTFTGHTGNGDVQLRFEQIRSIERDSPDAATVTLADGNSVDVAGERLRKVVVQGRRVRTAGGVHTATPADRGLYVDDPRYGRVLVSWEVLERVDFTPGGAVPTWASYEPGRPLMGSVTTRSGSQLNGRLVFDLDESETTETLDAPMRGVDYTIPFRLIESISLPGMGTTGPFASLTLRGGELLRLERSGDLGEGHGGMLVFIDGGQHPAYIPWSDVAHISLAHPASG